MYITVWIERRPYQADVKINVRFDGGRITSDTGPLLCFTFLTNTIALLNASAIASGTEENHAICATNHGVLHYN